MIIINIIITKSEPEVDESECVPEETEEEIEKPKVTKKANSPKKKKYYFRILK